MLICVISVLTNISTSAVTSRVGLSRTHFHWCKPVWFKISENIAITFWVFVEGHLRSTNIRHYYHYSVGPKKNIVRVAGVRLFYRPDPLPVLSPNQPCYSTERRSSSTRAVKIQPLLDHCAGIAYSLCHVCQRYALQPIASALLITLRAS